MQQQIYKNYQNMKLIVDFSKKEIKKMNQFEVVIDFMEGDADGYEDLKFNFEENLSTDKKFMDDFKEFWICTNECIELDGKGRGGLESLKDLYNHYSGIENWSKFVGDSEFESFFKYVIPTCNYGMFHSYESVLIFYYDKNGDKFPVKVKMKSI